MPPRKSIDAAKQLHFEQAVATTRTAPTTVDSSEEEDDAEGVDKGKDREKDVVSIDDNTLPKSIIMRLSKGVLPANTQIQKDALTALTRAATVFANHLAGTAHEFTLRTNKKTIAPKDVLEAIDYLEFGEFRARLEAELAVFNEIAAEKKNKSKSKSSTSAVSATTAGGNNPTVSDDESGARPAKRPRKSTDPSTQTVEEDDDDVDEDLDATSEDEVEEGDEEEGDEVDEEDEGGSGEEGGEDMLEDVVQDVEGDEEEEEEADEALDDESDSD